MPALRPPSSLIAVLVALVVSAALLQSSPATSAAAPPRPTTLTLTGPAQAAPGASVRLDVTLLTTDDGEPVSGAGVTVWTYDRGVATKAAEVITGAGGAASASAVMSARAADNRFYATYAGGPAYGASRAAELSVATAEAPASTLTLDGPAEAEKKRELTLRVRLQAEEPVADAVVEIERKTGTTWQRVARVRTDAAGTAAVTTGTPSGPDLVHYRARFEGSAAAQGSTSTVLTVRTRKQAITVALSGPARIVDETKGTLKIRVRTGAGDPVRLARLVVERKLGKKWRQVATTRTDAAGRARTVVRPRRDTRYRALVSSGAYYLGGRSAVLGVDNVPPGKPVVLPAAAPRPRALPTQARAVGRGVNVVVTAIPAKVWADMQGKSWRSGCTARTNLRLLRTNYWGFDGYRHRGELVVAASAADKFKKAVTGIYAARLPVRSMYRVDRFGYSSRVGGGDNYASMASDNTSAFNCRDVVGRPGVRSPHSTGRAFDINPWENPYASSGGWVPNTWWVSRSHPLVAWRSSSHLMVRTMRGAGFRWTYGTRDAHHFDG